MSWIPSYKKPGGGSGYVPPEWSTGTDAEIVEALEKHYNDEIDLTEFWSIGDERVVPLSAIDNFESHAAQNVTLVLTEIGGLSLVTPINGHTECVFQVDQKNTLDEYGGITLSNNDTGGYVNSQRRYWLNHSYLWAYPETLRTIFKPHYYSCCTGGPSYYYDNPGTYSDTFVFRSTKEITGSEDYTNPSLEANISQVEWYKTAANRNKTNPDLAKYWTRSIYLSGYSESYFVYILNGSAQGNTTNGRGSRGNGIAPYTVI